MRYTSLTRFEFQTDCGCWHDLATGQSGKCDYHSGGDWLAWAIEEDNE